MTPPDSGERCTWNGYTDNNLSGQCSLRRGHDGPHEIAKPDSGEREVLCGASTSARWPRYDAFVCLLATGHGGPHCSGDAFWTDATTQDPPVVLPLSLAQRILAALYAAGMGALADELRAIVERKT